MKHRFRFSAVLGFALLAPLVLAQSQDLHLPRTIRAGSAFSIQTSGSGPAVLYIVGPAQVLKRDVQLGQPLSFAPGDLTNAGHYLVLIAGDSLTKSGTFDVLPASEPAAVSFLAKPSRLPVALHDGISGVVYVFDTFQNLLVDPLQVSFQLSGVGGAPQTKTVSTTQGVAWTKMDSASREGAAQFVAHVGNTNSTRVIQQVPGEPCSIRMSARPSGKRLAVETEPVRDCTGNAVPDGTIVTFTESYRGGEATVDVPLKRGIAKSELPVHEDATISVATGVVMGNEVHLGKER